MIGTRSKGSGGLIPLLILSDGRGDRHLNRYLKPLVNSLDPIANGSFASEIGQLPHWDKDDESKGPNGGNPRRGQNYAMDVNSLSEGFLPFS